MTALLLGIQTVFFCVSISHMVDADVYTSFPAGSEQDIWHMQQLMRCLNGAQTPPITSDANVQNPISALLQEGILLMATAEREACERKVLVNATVSEATMQTNPLLKQVCSLKKLTNKAFQLL